MIAAAPRRRSLSVLLCLGSLLLLTASRAEDAAPAEAAAGFILPGVPAGRPGPELQGALKLARKLGPTAVIVPGGCGDFAGEQGGAISLDGFRVIWCHQGDSIDDTGPVHDRRTVEALRRFVGAGGGLFLSGAALAMVESLGIEAAKPRRGAPGNDRVPAALVPLDADHPIFGGLAFDGRLVRVSDAGYPAFADFHGTSGPAEGMLLARTPSGTENPLVEYELGKGRVLAMGWRLPHYGHGTNAHRANLEHLTGNILSYLGDRRSWREVVVRPDRVLASGRPHAGVAVSEWRSLELAVRDLIETFGERYPRGEEYLKRLEAMKNAPGEGTVERFDALRAEALLSNPLLDFEKLLLVKRRADRLGLPMNWESNSSLPMTGYGNEIALLSPPRPGGKLSTLYRPEGDRFAGDVDLHYDGDRMLFSMPGSNGRWQVHELGADGSSPRELPLIREPDVDNYDACYLPDGRVIFTSTAPFVGVPCVRGSSHVTNLYLLGTDGGIRQLTVDQEHDWCPTVLSSGRILYLRWEYTDTPHAFYRILFHMNPDGTEQRELYGSNSYWPNAMFYARPIPGHPSKVVAIVGGHHDNPRMGELVIFDPARGRYEADGVVQRIPGHGKKVNPVIRDDLTADSWPKFLHPYPLSEKYFIVSSKPSPESLWGIYLADVFDNRLLLHEEAGHAMLEPIPVRRTPRPPVIPDRVDTSRKDAVVFLADVYAGDAMKGLARGTVKALRLVGYEFAFHGMGGQIDRVGFDGPWDVKRILGTVPVEEDGSAMFRVPAYTPIAVQPLDAEGKAVQLMRSWFTAMPGETVSCTGCHEPQNSAPAPRRSIAALRQPAEIKPWHGPARGFSFNREVQPVLDRLCIACHDAKASPERRASPDLTRREPVHLQAGSPDYNAGARFPPSYIELRRVVRSPTIESDLHVLPPREFHADTTRLVQMLRKGHHGVVLDREAWDRIVTWIDLHAPAHGTWTEVCGEERVKRLNGRRRALRKLYTGVDEDPEAVPDPPRASSPPAPPEVAEAAAVLAVPAGTPPPAPSSCPGWPFDAVEARRRQGAGANSNVLSIELAPGVSMDLVRIPEGQFLLGDENGFRDERPLTRVEIPRSFWMGRLEVTNEQFAIFDPSHDSRLEHGEFLQFDERERGYALNAPSQPVVRVSWIEAMAFCEWLSERTGRKLTLPTEAEWEYACRAGTSTSLGYGVLDADFSPFANVSDATHQLVDTFGWGLPSGAIPRWHPADARFDDGARVSAPAGSYRPNPWGLHDMHGNVAEWTRSEYEAYPYDAKDGREAATPAGRKTVRGGSWYDRPEHCRSAVRLSYAADQVVYDVGFRVVCEAGAPAIR